MLGKVASLERQVAELSRACDALARRGAALSLPSTAVVELHESHAHHHTHSREYSTSKATPVYAYNGPIGVRGPEDGVRGQPGETQDLDDPSGYDGGFRLGGDGRPFEAQGVLEAMRAPLEIISLALCR